MPEALLAGLAIVCSAYWVMTALAALRIARGVPLLARLSPPDPPRWPRVSVIIPACNEEPTIEQAVRSRLAEGYPDAEYVLVDDRSTDGTPAIVDRLARDDARIVPIHVAALPAGWLGKLHAMHVALAHATGEWVLFSDADVHHEPGTLRRVIAHAEQRGIDHITVFPTVWSRGFWLAAAMTTFLRILTIASRAWKVPDPRSRISIGGGNFNLVRRSALERAGGLAPLRMEVVDDAALGQALKWSGARSCVLNARGFVGLWYYTSLRDLVLGMEKNAFAVLGRLRIAPFAIAIAAVCVLELGAFVALASTTGWVVTLAGGSLVIAIGAQLAIARWLDRPLAPAVVAPFGIAVFVIGALRSMAIAIRRDGIAWRGTHYPLAALRAGRRLVLR